MIKDFSSGDREDFYGLGLSPSMKSRLAEKMAENAKTRYCWGKITTVPIRNTEIQLSMSKIIRVFEGFKHLWSKKSDWNVQ